MNDRLSVSSPRPSCQCGSTEPCACSDIDALLSSSAQRLVHDALDCARECRFQDAVSQFRLARAITPLEPTVLIAYALACFATGEVQLAHALLQEAAQSPSAAKAATRILATLRSSEVQRALQDYDEALRDARAGDVSRALERVRRARLSLPDFVPAARLESLLLRDAADALPSLQQGGARSPAAAAPERPTGDHGNRARASSTPQLSAIRGRQRRTTFAALALVTLGGIFGGGVERLRRPSPTSPIAATSTVEQPPGEMAADFPARPTGMLVGSDSATPVSLVTLALSDQPRDLVTLRTLFAPASDSLPSQLASRLSGRIAALAYGAYRDALRARAVSDTLRLIASLEASLLAPPTAYYLDDAMYLLAQTLAARGHGADAAFVAQRLLRDHPTSPFANSITRGIAAAP